MKLQSRYLPIFLCLFVFSNNNYASSQNLQISFPAGYSYGWIGHSLLPAAANIKKLKWKDQIEAKGLVTLPIGHDLAFSGNGRLCEEPQVLDVLPTNLSCLFLSNLEIDDKIAEHLKRFRQIERLDLSNTEITDASLAAIGSLASLVRLDLSRTMIRGSELSKLTGLKKLTHLRLANNNLRTGSVAAIASLTGLQHLELMRCGLTDDDLNKLKTLTELKGIELTDNKKLSDRSLEALQGMKKLYWLNLEGTSYTASAIASKLGNRALRLTFYKGQFSQADKQLLQSRNKFLVLNEVDRKLRADPTVFAPLH